MIKTLIVSGGNVEDNILDSLKDEFNYIIASDRGLEVLDKFNVVPNYIIGDFDSIDKNILEKYINNKDIIIKELNPEKDYTDTHMAIKLAIELNSKQITIVGAIGTRIDHTIANIHIIKETLDNNVECKIIDERNEIQLINKRTTLEKDEKYKYVSLIPLTTKVEGISLKGFKYSLSNATLEIGHSIGVSNEQIQDSAEIDLGEGVLILIKSKD
ncbi:MAG: thiamine diphosphokinase [Clostridia bacterium]|nr:thiamine diphosphokinase [Clostridia bacterium]